MNDDELLRYNRHILLPALDIEGQQRICQAKVLIIGVGGLGCPAALYLAAAGVGDLWLADPDTVELTNLQRQIAHGEGDIGNSKVASAAAAVGRLNASVTVHSIVERLEGAVLVDAVAAADVVLDCTDNYASRFAINAACLSTKTPLIMAAAIRFEGQLTVFDFRRDDSPCYRCLYSDAGDDSGSCSENGVLGPLVGMLGSLQAAECLKLLADCGDSLCGRLQLFDLLHGDFRQLGLSRDADCPACGNI